MSCVEHKMMKLFISTSSASEDEEKFDGLEDEKFDGLDVEKFEGLDVEKLDLEKGSLEF